MVSKLNKQTKNSQHRRSSIKRRPLLIILILFAILLLSLGAAKLIMLFSQNNQVADLSPDPEPAVQPLAETTQGDTKTPRQYEGEDANQLDHLTGYFSTVDFSDGVLTLRVVINQFIQSGTCSLTLSHSSGSSVTKTAKIITNPSTSTCEGFDIPANELTAGKYQLSLKIDSSNKTGTITGEVNI